LSGRDNSPTDLRVTPTIFTTAVKIVGVRVVKIVGVKTRAWSPPIHPDDLHGRYASVVKIVG
jgi:hypothetical protein